MTVSAVSGSASPAWNPRTLDDSAGGEDNVERQPPSLGGERRAAVSARYQNAMSLEDVTSPRAQSNLALLASSLGTDPATLLAHVTSGQDVRSLLSRSGDAGYGTSIADSGIGGIAIDQYA
jgi:hypothetical protein